MRWLKSRRGADTAEAGPTEDTAADAVPKPVVDDENQTAEATEVDEADPGDWSTRARRRSRVSSVIAFIVLPVFAMLLAAGAGYLKYYDASAGEMLSAQKDSVKAASDGTIALLSYKPGTVEQDLKAARSRLTGQFLDAYTSLIDDVVIPGAKQKQISAEATVPAASSISATDSRATVLLFVNQTVVIGKDAPANTASSVKVTLDKVDGRWLISQFDPV